MSNEIPMTVAVSSEQFLKLAELLNHVSDFQSGRMHGVPSMYCGIKNAEPFESIYGGLEYNNIGAIFWNGHCPGKEITFYELDGDGDFCDGDLSVTYTIYDTIDLVVYDAQTFKRYEASVHGCTIDALQEFLTACIDSLGLTPPRPMRNMNQIKPSTTLEIIN